MDLQSKGDSGRRQSDEPAPAKGSVDNISAMNTLEFLARTVRAQHENGELTDEHRGGKPLEGIASPGVGRIRLEESRRIGRQARMTQAIPSVVVAAMSW